MSSKSVSLSHNFLPAHIVSPMTSVILVRCSSACENNKLVSLHSAASLCQLHMTVKIT